MVSGSAAAWGGAGSFVGLILQEDPAIKRAPNSLFLRSELRPSWTGKRRSGRAGPFHSKITACWSHKIIDTKKDGLHKSQATTVMGLREMPHGSRVQIVTSC